jgi:hypothetical protein
MNTLAAEIAIPISVALLILAGVAIGLVVAWWLIFRAAMRERNDVAEFPESDPRNFG